MSTIFPKRDGWNQDWWVALFLAAMAGWSLWHLTHRHHNPKPQGAARNQTMIETRAQQLPRLENGLGWKDVVEVMPVPEAGFAAVVYCNYHPKPPNTCMEPQLITAHMALTSDPLPIVDDKVYVVAYSLGTRMQHMQNPLELWILPQLPPTG